MSLLIFSFPSFSQERSESLLSQSSAPINTPLLFSKSSYQISGLNPNAESNPKGAYYPGFRGANQLLIYTKAYGERTGTNEFGIEAIIQNNRVVKIGGADSLIPGGGIVISGHGKAKQWILTNLIEGAKITINLDKNTVESSITPESYIFKAENKYNETKKEMNVLYSSKDKKSEYFNISLNSLKIAKNDILKAKKQLKLKSFDNVYNYSQASIDASNKSFYNAVPSIENEFKGIWVRPTEKTVEGIAKTLDRIQNSGINNVFLETYYQGYTIFPSKTMEKYGIIAQRKEFVGFDPLSVWVEEAHKRGIKLHVWFQTFYAGNEAKTAKYKNLISAHPDWGNIQRRAYLESAPSRSELEHSGYFLDPANPCVQNYLLDLLDEITTNYKIDGVNLDYIRYPASLAESFPNYLGSTWGYTVYARKEFKKLYGVDPAYISKTEGYWDKWTAYRQNKVTAFVTKAGELLKNRNVIVSAVVFPDQYEAKVKKLQSWDLWAANGSVSAFTPLVLGGDAELINNYVSEMKLKTPANIMIYPGLFQPFNNENPFDLLKQLLASRKAGGNGVMIFDYAHYTDEFKNALLLRVFKAPQKK